MYHAFCICRGSEWEAIDLMDVVVHVFSAEQRDKYNLDEYYSQAEVFAVFITLDGCSLPVSEVFRLVHLQSSIWCSGLEQETTI